MNVLLVRPPEPQMSRFYNKGESLGLGYLAAVLRQQGYTVEILDCVLFDWNQEQALEEISRRDFGVLGFTIFAVAMDDAARLASALRAQGCDAHMTMGGHFPSFRAEQVLDEFPQFDSVVKFDGEFTFLELIQSVEANKPFDDIKGLIWRDGDRVRVNIPRGPITDLDALPFPSRDMLPYALKWERDAFVCTSRGCWAKCTYCSISPFSRASGAPPWRARSPKNVVDEFEFLVRTFDPPAIGVVDADFVGPGLKGRERATAIADEILSRGLEFRLGVYTRVDEVETKLFEKLKSAGLTTVYLGVESGVQTVLDRWQKRTTVEQNFKALEICNRLDIRVEAGFMLYDPYTTLAEIRENLQFLRETRVFDFPSLLARMEVRAGMSMENQLRAENRLTGSYRDTSYTMPDPAAEMFHSELSRLLEPLALVYLRLRDLRHSANGHADVVSAAQERLNMKALVLAQQLAEISSVVDLSAAKNRDFASVEQAAQDEAEVLSRVCVFIEQDHQSESARLHEPVAIPLQTASYHQLQFTEPC